MKRYVYCCAALGVLFCQPLLAQAPPTWQTIQERIFDTNCISCHQAGTSFARQSGLLLTEDVAYQQLVNVPPKNKAAREDGLVRVSDQGLAGLYKSFLWEKVNAPDQEHFYSDHPYYGSMMPLGGKPLTNGELEFLRRWIVAGAPQTGDVVDTSVLQDTTRFQPPPFAPLDPPENGLQFHLGPFDVPANFDREIFYYEPLDHDQDLFINQIEVVMRPGSHHFIFYTFQDNIPSYYIPQPRTIRDIRDSNGNYIQANLYVMQFQKFFAGTQWPILNYHFPPGVALRLPAGKGFDLNSHYANRTNQPIQAEIYANLYFADPARIEHVADVLFLNNLNITLPAKQVTTLTRTFKMEERIHIFQLFSHAHEHMTEFKVEIAGGPRDGELIYISYDWEHPPILELDPPITLEPGQGLRLITTYNNWTDRTLHFGLLSSDEMMILFGYYYTDIATAVETPQPPDLPRTFSLAPNYPNPFNPATTFEFNLPQSAEVRLEIFSLRGTPVKSLVQGNLAAGKHRVSWDASGLPAGIYFAKMQAGAFHQTRKLILLK